MSKLFKAALLTAGLTALCFTASAHHSRSNFDDSKTVTIAGEVREFAWSNPHIFIEVESEGKTWLVEAGSVTSMRRRGWSEDMLEPGDEVSFTGNPDKDSAKNFMVMRSLTLPDGKQMSSRGGQERGPVTPSTDFSGIWHMDMRGFDIAAAGGPPPTDWPYTETGKTMAASYDAEDSPELKCKKIGVPRILVYPYNISFERTEKSLNVFKEHLNERRTIWFDQADAQSANETPSPTGTSVVTHMSDTELHIYTDNFTPTEWGVENALDSSDQKVVEELYKLSDDGLRIDMEISITDPVLFTAPIVREVSFVKQPDIELAEIPCDPRAADRHVTLSTQQDAVQKTPWWSVWE